MCLPLRPKQTCTGWSLCSDGVMFSPRVCCRSQSCIDVCGCPRDFRRFNCKRSRVNRLLFIRFVGVAGVPCGQRVIVECVFLRITRHRCSVTQSMIICDKSELSAAFIANVYTGLVSVGRLVYRQADFVLRRLHSLRDVGDDAKLFWARLSKLPLNVPP